MPSRRRPDAESTVRRGVRTSLSPEVRLVGSCTRLLDRVAGYLDHCSPRSPWHEAQAALLSRLADICRVFGWSIECGYSVPALALGASLDEYGYLSAFIADQSDLADRWLKWHDLRKLPWRRTDVRAGAYQNAVGGAPADTQDFAYAMLAMAKHGNANITAKLPVPHTAEAHIIESHPVFSAKASTRVRLIITMSLRSTIVALCVLYTRGHLRPPLTRDLERVAAEFVRIDKLRAVGGSAT